ncbi:MurR/RpiR family transcriptional regulator [Vibrio pomeroyi]|uniref:MurR/RpiR family transcriptional regulator n=1 Tax=Vibrio pomeroyi TaxID=198832 RepID=UPI0035A5A77B
MQSAKTIMPLDHTEAELASTWESLHFLISNRKQIDRVVEVIKQSKRLFVVGSGESFVAARYFEEIFKFTDKYVTAVQSFDFFKRYSSRLDSETCVLVVSSSGRPSLVIDVLKSVIDSPATSIVLTNNAKVWRAEDVPDLFYSTFASKKGMPTQSTVATFVALLLVAQQLMPAVKRFYSLDLFDYVLGFDTEIVEILATHRNKIETFYDSKYRYSCVGTGFGAILSESFANLLVCGPEVEANFMEIEEYHHSLRMFIPQREKVIFITCDSENLDPFVHDTIDELLVKSARVVLICTYDVSQYSFSKDENFTAISLLRRGKCSQEVKSLFLLNIIQHITFYMAIYATECGYVRAEI